MISAQDARDAMSKRRNIKKETFKAILENFMRKIRLAIERGQTKVLLQVPEFVPGLPIYDRTFATEYLTRQLTRLGYQSTPISQWVIHVAWSREPPPTPPTPPSFSTTQRLAEELRIKNQRR